MAAQEHNVRFDFAANVPSGTIKEGFRAMLQASKRRSASTSSWRAWCDA